jgi:fibro-slime domain-containing protein
MPSNYLNLLRWVASMKFSMKAAVVCFGMLAFCAPANAITVTGTVDYYAQPVGTDFGNGAFCCGAHYNNEVLGTLVNGRPVYNTGYGGVAITQLNGDGTLAWWNSAQLTSSNNPFTTNPAGSYSASIFPPNGTGGSNSSAFQTAIFSLNLLANTSYTLTYTGDDDVFVALGNQVISQDGGVHAAGQSNTVTFNTGAANSPLSIFFADRYQVDSSLSFTVEAAAVPGPVVGAGIPGLLMALGGIVAWRRRRNQAAVA